MIAVPRFLQAAFDFTRVKKTDGTLAAITAIFSVCIVVANIAAAKVCTFWIFEFDAGLLAYPITFLCIDVINEVWGRKYAQRAVITGISLQVLTVILLYCTINLPCSPYVSAFSDQYATVLSSTGRIVVASLAAYLVSQLLDVRLFHFFKSRYSPKWIRSGGSSVISQMADSTLFAVIAFAGIIPDLWVMILSSYFFKFITSVMVTPFFYFFTRGDRRLE